MSAEEFILKFKNIANSSLDSTSILSKLLERNPDILDFSKWGKYLPIKYQIELLKSSYFDFKGALYFFDTIKITQNND